MLNGFESGANAKTRFDADRYRLPSLKSKSKSTLGPAWTPKPAPRPVVTPIDTTRMDTKV
eukprot:scaffold122690_cov49-Attheya_sp.AAC.1